MYLGHLYNQDIYLGHFYNQDIYFIIRTPLMFRSLKLHVQVYLFGGGMC